MPSNSEFQHEFNPSKNFRRVDLYDSQTGEAEYEDRGLRLGEFKTKLELIEVKELE